MARIEKWDEVHGNQAPDERMMAFLDGATDQYAILQLRRSEDTVYERFSSMRELERMGLEPDIDHYEVVYTAPLLPYKDQNTMLEELYAKFNVSRPDDFTGHSLSVSDIVALRQNGVVSCHYVDSIGFQELPGFLKPENYLKAAGGKSISSGSAEGKAGGCAACAASQVLRRKGVINAFYG